MQPKIKVGIMFAPQVSFSLHGNFRISGSDQWLTGNAMVELVNQEALLHVKGKTEKLSLPLHLEPQEPASQYFDLKEVTIGINFHWERKEDQRFTGELSIIEENGLLTAVNILPLEDYLKSVISSEMSATSSDELLKAHAVISRSWLLAQIEKGEQLLQQGPQQSCFETPEERVRWYDREDHVNFDVCADDHCQRYQGITRATTAAVSKAIDQTAGRVLQYDGKICDARYSKCCGGISELFENAWEPVHHPYLVPVMDNDHAPEGFSHIASDEETARRWILGNPDAFCNTSDKQVLSQVLNDYDQETPDFYRWSVSLSQEEICRLLRDRIQVDVGQVLDLEPLQRGPSGRLVRLRIVGTERSFVIGKELEIRKAFSASHLYSAAFVAEKHEVKQGVPAGFTLRGAGWGHGVGLCQIGAAVMGAKGYNWEEILQHYFRGAEIAKRY
ncbi:MAG: SpoIID/LytB domain-containing protein [Bacteroidales bacterium]